MAAVNNEARAFFLITSTPAISSRLVPLGEAIGIIPHLISNHFTLRDEYDIELQGNNSSGYAYFISASAEQLTQAQPIFPINKDIDGVLISTKQ